MHRHENNAMGLFEWFLLIVLSVIWGGAFFFNKIAVTDIPPFTVVLCRVGIAAVALNGFVYATGRRMPASWKMWGLFTIMGTLNNLIPFSLILWGQTEIASGLASILNGTTPLWTVLFAHFLTRDEKLTGNRLTGIALGIFGVVTIIGPDALTGFGSNVTAQLAVVGGAVFYALAGVFGKRFRGVSPYVLATGQLTCSAVIMIPIVAYIDKPWSMPVPGVRVLGAVVALALVCSALAYVIYFRILASAGATNLLLVTFLIPVSALLLGILVLGERLEFRHYAGMSVIGFGLAAIDGRLADFIRSKRPKPKKTPGTVEEFSS